MKNIDILEEEHEIIMQVLSVFEDVAVSIKKTNTIPKDVIAEMIDFFRVFADTCHHAKEEKYLFEKLIQKGMERKDSPVESMMLEHEKGREHLRCIQKLIESEISSEVCEKTYKEINDFINLLRTHIDKENNMIFMMVENFITEEEDLALTEIFEKTNIEQKNFQEKYRNYANNLKN